MSQLVAQPTDLIGVGSGPESATRLAQELRRQGGKAPLVAGSTIADPELPRLMGRGRRRHHHPDHVLCQLQRAHQASSKTSSQAPKAAGIDRSASAQFDAATYDIVLIYAQAMKTAKVTGDPAKLAAERTAHP